MARPRDNPIGLENIVLESLLHRIVKVRDIALALEERIGVLVHFASWRSGEPHEKRIEILEYRTVLVEDRPMRLVNDHEIEASGGELLFRAVNLVDHRLVCRKGDTGIGTSLERGIRYDRARVVR